MMDKLHHPTKRFDIVNSFLYYSYYPNCYRFGLKDEIIKAASEEIISEDYNTLVTLGKEAFRTAVAKSFEHSSTHIVPLSSGLDSRAILATLLDHQDVAPSDIQTVSFGLPGTWDFELGQQIAETAGVGHTAVDLSDSSFDWSIESLRGYAARQDCLARVLDGYINSKVKSICTTDSIVWSGFMGDPTAGGHQPRDPCDEWDRACKGFRAHEQYTTDLIHPDFEPTSVLPDNQYLSKEALTFEEQLDFAHRQQCLIYPIVVHSDIYKTPFMQPEWLKFSLNIPHEYRKNRRLFKQIFFDACPYLFELPTDANYGLPITAGKWRCLARRTRLFLTRKLSSVVNFGYTHPSTNYFDFARAFRSGAKLGNTANTLVQSFEERGVADWVDVEKIWQDHQSGIDRTNEIHTICSLELHMRSTTS